MKHGPSTVTSFSTRASGEIQGALGETARLEFHPSAHALTAPGAIHFARGTFNIAARSGRYDVPKHELTLAGPVSGSGTGELLESYSYSNIKYNVGVADTAFE